MSAFEAIRWDRSGPVLTLTLYRPEKMNAMTRAMRRELCEAIDRADADDAVRAIVVTGAGRAFCAGFDLSEGAGAFGAPPHPATNRTVTAAACSRCGSSPAPSR